MIKPKREEAGFSAESQTDHQWRSWGATRFQDATRKVPDGQRSAQMAGVLGTAECGIHNTGSWAREESLGHQGVCNWPLCSLLPGLQLQPHEATPSGAASGRDENSCGWRLHRRTNSRVAASRFLGGSGVPGLQTRTVASVSEAQYRTSSQIRDRVVTDGRTIGCWVQGAAWM